MRKACFGISRYFEKFKNSEMWDKLEIELLFDNDSDKWGTKIDNLSVEQPRYLEDVLVYITLGPKYHLEIIRELLEIGYRQFVLVLKHEEDVYTFQELNYAEKDYISDKASLVLLYLERKSFSSMCAIEWMQKNKDIDPHGFKTKMFLNNKEDKDYYYDIATARYVLTEMTWPYRNMQADIVQMWHGFSLKAMGQMTSQYDMNNEKYMYDEWKRYKIILSYGKNYTTSISACYGTRYNQYKVTGMPRNDLLFYTDGRKLLEERFPNAKGKKVVLYMPTFREAFGKTDGSTGGYVFYWDSFNEKVFCEFFEKNNVFFIFKLHPGDESKVKEWCKNSHNIGVLTESLMGDNCMYEFLNGTDMLITDYSSIYFDYMLLDRPIIFTNQDEEEYLANRGMLFEPLDFWRPGPLVNTMEDLQSEIVKVLGGEDSHREHRKQLMPFVHKYTDGNSTQRLFDLLKEDSEKTDEE